MTIPIADRLAGAVWGHLVGDALGVPYEFRPAPHIGEVRWGASGSHGQPPGTWSDDGGLMLSLLDSLLCAGFDLEDQGRRAVAWYETDAYKPGGLFDVGNTTSRALERIQAGVPAIDAGGAGERDNGNGALMRVLPVALFKPGLSSEEVVNYAMGAGCITHAHPRSQLVCAVYCAAAHRLLAGETDTDAVLAGAIRDVEAAAPDQLLAELPGFRAHGARDGSGYVVDTFWSAWTAFGENGDYRPVVEAAVAYGNDTDTTACVAGSLAGLRWGINSIPADWLTGMRGRDIVAPLVATLIERWQSS